MAGLQPGFVAPYVSRFSVVYILLKEGALLLLLRLPCFLSKGKTTASTVWRGEGAQIGIEEDLIEWR